MNCRGFWNMCGCVACLKKDRELANKLDTQNPDERRVTLDAAVKELMEAQFNGNAPQR